MSRLFDRIRSAGRSLRPDAGQGAEATRPLDRRAPEQPDPGGYGQGRGPNPGQVPPSQTAPPAGGYGNGGPAAYRQDGRGSQGQARSNHPASQSPSLGRGQPQTGHPQTGQVPRSQAVHTGRPAPDMHGLQEPLFTQNLPPRRDVPQTQVRPAGPDQASDARSFDQDNAGEPGRDGAMQPVGQDGGGQNGGGPPKKGRRGKAVGRRLGSSLRNPSRKISVNAPIVEAGSVTGKSLTLVITIMCFLACLTAGAVYLINQSASAWLKDIASEVTVQIQPRENEDLSKRVTQVAFFLAKQRGIAGVRPLTIDESAKLLEPWLGQSGVLKELPVPRLIAIEVDRQAPPNFTRLKAALAKAFPDATLDDHRRWQTQIRTVTRSMALGGLLILMLVGAATTAIIVSATRSAMASNKEIVEVLHFVGATDRFIAREFEKHFLSLGIKAGLVGALSAMFVFFVMPWAMRVLGGGAVTQSELRRLVGAGALDMPGYFLLGIVVIVIAALCMLTSRYGVFRILNSQS